jgi:IclR family pca regulon transcriptional regulator
MIGGNSDRSDGFVQSLERGLRVVQAFGEGHARMTLSEVAERTELSRATARRFLLTLVELGFVHSDGQHFTLGPKVLDLGYSYLSGFGLPSLALPIMENAVSQVHESCSLTVLDGAEVVYVARVPVRRIMSVQIDVGTRFPAFATSMGRVFLSDLSVEERATLLESAPRLRFTPYTVTEISELNKALDSVAARDYALACEELELGLLSIAVPVRNRATGRVVAALNMSTHAGQRDETFMREIALPVLRDAADQIEQAIRSSGIGVTDARVNVTQPELNR